MKLYRVAAGAVAELNGTSYAYQGDWDELVNRANLFEHLPDQWST